MAGIMDVAMFLKRSAAPAPASDPYAAQRKRLADLDSRLANFKAPDALKTEAMPVVKQIQGPLADFNPIRERVEQQSRAGEQEQQDALRRRFASMGALNTGAAIKQQQLTQQNAQQQRQQALGEVNLQENMERQRRQEIQDQQNLAREEAAQSRNFAREQFNAQQDFQSKVFQFDSASKLGQLDLALEQLGIQKDESEFNKRMERYKAGHSGGLLGGGGFLGTGIGAQSADI